MTIIFDSYKIVQLMFDGVAFKLNQNCKEHIFSMNLHWNSELAKKVDFEFLAPSTLFLFASIIVTFVVVPNHSPLHNFYLYAFVKNRT